MLCLTMLVVTSCYDEKVPPAVHTFIEQYFPDQSVLFMETDEDEDGMEYSVWLKNGLKVDFDETGEWKRLSRKKTGVPAELIPPSIAEYVKVNYPEDVVFKLSKKTYGYKIELSNDLELRFDERGQFLTTDE